MSDELEFFSPVFRGAEDLLATELTALGAVDVRPSTTGVSFRATRTAAYRVCLWSRLASRVLQRLDEVPAEDTDALYAGVSKLPWAQWMRAGDTFAVHVTVGAKAMVRQGQFAMLRVKDAIVDTLRSDWGHRPNVDVEDPTVPVRVVLRGDRAVVFADWAGAPLHRRGYRARSVAAPLKETLAAAILLRAGWDEMLPAPLLDPMCGSGTLVLEAATMAGDMAPGRYRRFAFEGMRDFDRDVWDALQTEAHARAKTGKARLEACSFHGFDQDPDAVDAARRGAERLGLLQQVQFERCAVHQVTAPPGTGLVVTNPPYGERLGDVETLGPLYAELGSVLRERFDGWRAAVFTGTPKLGLHLGLKARKRNVLWNGPIESQLLTIDVSAAAETKRSPRENVDETAPSLSEGAQALANRIRKNLKPLRKWAKTAETDCYRIYDKDMPEYAVAVDVYGDHALVQEYAPPKTVDPARARKRLGEALAAVRSVLSLPKDRVHVRKRERKRGKAQYERVSENKLEIVVREGPAKFWVNLSDYLDVGLFLDHRPTRRWIHDHANGTRFLNLFAYTGTATVHAALGGARSTTTVDLSRTYLDWTDRNLELNRIPPEGHDLVQADVVQWMAEQTRKWDLIFLDPPTFSSSKRMEGTLDVQRDHVTLIRQAAAMLSPKGTLVFSTNARKFKLDADALEGLIVRDVTEESRPRDFARNTRIHRCYRIRRGKR